MFVLLTAILESNDFLQRETSRDEIETFYSLIPTFVSLHDCMITRERTPDWYWLALFLRRLQKVWPSRFRPPLGASLESEAWSFVCWITSFLICQKKNCLASGNSWGSRGRKLTILHFIQSFFPVFLSLPAARRLKEEKCKMASSEMQSVVEEMDHTITRKRNDEFLFFQEVWWREKGRNLMKASIALSQRRKSCHFWYLFRTKCL